MPVQRQNKGTYLREQFVIRAYSKQEEILDAALVDAGRARRMSSMASSSALKPRFCTLVFRRTAASRAASIARVSGRVTEAPRDTTRARRRSLR